MRPYTAPRAISALTYEVAEGPVWDSIRQRLLWVDIPKGHVMSAALTSDGMLEAAQVTRFPDTAGAVAVSATGRLLVAGRHRLYTSDEAGTIHPGPVLISGPEDRRLNDGKVDPGGRFVVGSLRERGWSASEVLVLVSNGEMLTIDDDLTLSNGLAWSLDGTLLYSVDSVAQRVYVRPYDPENGATGQRRVLVELTDGLPDGICVDSEDHLWLAVWGPGQVRRYSPEGRLVGVVDVPAPHTTSVAFVGKDLDTLVITTATADLSEEQLTDYPLSGRLFTLKPGVNGPHLPLWSGVL